MANSYIEFRGKAARLNDQLLTVIVILAVDVVGSGDWPEMARDLTGDWLSRVLDAPPGLIDLELTGFWETDLGEELLLLILEGVRERLESFGTFVPKRFLGRYGEGGVGFVDTDVPLVVRELEKWISVVREGSRL